MTEISVESNFRLRIHWGAEPFLRQKGANYAVLRRTSFSALRVHSGIRPAATMGFSSRISGPARSFLSPSPAEPFRNRFLAPCSGGLACGFRKSRPTALQASCGSSHDVFLPFCRLLPKRDSPRSSGAPFHFLPSSAACRPLCATALLFFLSSSFRLRSEKSAPRPLVLPQRPCRSRTAADSLKTVALSIRLRL